MHLKNVDYMHVWIFGDFIAARTIRQLQRRNKKENIS